MQELKLLPATARDIDSIASLARKIWNAYYPPIIGQEQVDYMLNMMYSRESLIEQLEKKQHHFFLIVQNTEAVGFISVHHQNNRDWFLNKFYIDQEKAGKGIGAKAFDLLLKEIQPGTLSLTVNRGNFKAINFYFKLGFRIESTTRIDIGEGFVMDDFVMLWSHELHQ